MVFSILGSSSGGNCAFLATPHCKVLIDAGFSARQTQALLQPLGESIETIDAVFITHEHSDHSKGIQGLSNYPHIRFFANHGTAQAIQDRLKKKIKWSIFETNTLFSFRTLEVKSFSLPHDAHDPVGFTIACGGDTLFEPRRKIAWCMDLGYMPTHVQESVRDVDLLVLESNHDPEILDNHPKRPWHLKQRIKSRHGHLCNEAAFSFLSRSERPQWKQVCLAHLSKDCNSLAKVAATVAPIRQKNKPFRLSIVDPAAKAGHHYDLVTCKAISTAN